MADPTTDDPLLSLGHEDVAATSTWPPLEWGFTPPAPTQPGTGIPAAAFDAAAQTLAQPSAPPAPAAPTFEPDFVGTSPPAGTPIGAAGFGAIPERDLRAATDQLAQPRAPELAAPATPPPFGPSTGVPGAPSAEPMAPTPTTGEPGELELDNEYVGQGANPNVTSETTPEEKGLALAKLAETNPEAYAAIVANHESAKQERAAAAELELATSQRKQAQANYDNHEASQKTGAAAQQKLTQDALALANERVDPNHWMNTRTGGQRVAAFIAAFAGGLAAPSMGGRNIGLEQINREIDRDVEAQKENLGHRRAMLGVRQQGITQQLAQAADSYHAGEVLRLANQEQAIRQLQAEQQLYDPASSRAIRIGQTIVAVRAQQQEQVLKYGEAAQKMDLARREAALKDLQAKETARHNKADEQNAGWAIASENKRAAEALAESKASREQKQADKLDQDFAEKGLGDPATGLPMVSEEGTPMLAKSRELDTQARTAATPDEANALRVQARALRAEARTKYGIKLGRAEDTEKVQSQMAFAQGMSDLRAKIHAQLDADPGATNRNAWAGIDTDFQNLKIQYIRLNEGKPSSREMDAMSEIFGASPSDLNVRVLGQGKLKAHIDHVVDNAISDTNTLLKAKKVEGGWTPVPLKYDPYVATPANQLEQQSLDENPNPLSTKQEVEQGLDRAGTGATAMIPGVGPTLAGAKWLWDKSSGGGMSATDIRQENIRMLGGMATGRDTPAAARDEALAALAKVAQGGLTKTERELAAAILAGSSMPRSTEAVGDTRAMSIAHEEAP